MQSISEFVERRERFGPAYGWTTAAPRRRFIRHKSFQLLLKYFRLYCENSSLVGCRYLTEPRRSWVERFLWILIHLTTLCILVYMIYGVYELYLDTPVVTMVETDYYPTNYLEFPGVAICSVNRISRQSAMQMASEVANATNKAYEQIFGLLMELGNLYESTFTIHEDRTKTLHYVLQDYFKGPYNITDIMKRLTPQCNETLRKCNFNGQARNCSEIFKFRKTQDGFCCLFNYVRESDDFYNVSEAEDPIQPVRVNNLGIENGLTVVLEPFLDDYFYPILPITGWKVTIFNSGDYPDTTSGGVSEALVSPLSEAYLELDAVSFYSTSDIRPFPVAKRRCFFNDENSQQKHTIYASYTYSDCIVDCKIDDVWKHCGCRPFYYPRRGITEYSRKVCNVMDVLCLHKYKSKWWSVLPHEISGHSEEQRAFDKNTNKSWSLHCNCYPSCDDVHYLLHSSRSYMDPGFYKTNLMDHVNVTHQSLLHVFFSKWGTIRLKQDVAYRWFELLSNIGGICGVFIGFSLISVIELVYFVALTLRALWCKRDRSSGGPIAPGNWDNRLSVQTLYWDEIAPSMRVLPLRRGRREQPANRR